MFLLAIVIVVYMCASACLIEVKSLYASMMEMYSKYQYQFNVCTVCMRRISKNGIIQTWVNLIGIEKAKNQKHSSDSSRRFWLVDLSNPTRFTQIWVTTLLSRRNQNQFKIE